MKKIMILFIFNISFASSLRLANEFYDNRIPKSIYTYNETSSKIILKESTSYYKNGHMSYRVEYDSNGLNSRKTWWHDNGNKSKMITFKSGKIDGIWAKWTYDGMKETERLYKDGLMLREKLFKK